MKGDMAKIEFVLFEERSHSGFDSVAPALDAHQPASRNTPFEKEIGLPPRNRASGPRSRSDSNAREVPRRLWRSEHPDRKDCPVVTLQ